MNQSLLPSELNLLSLGFDIGGTNIRGLALQDGNQISQLYQRPHLGDLDLIVETITEVSNRIQIEIGKKITILGIGCAGLITENGVVKTSPNIQAVNNFPLRKIIEENVGVEVFVENDANCSTWAEVQLGAAKNRSSVVVISLGTGIGAGIAFDGQLQKGASGFAGEVGHMIIERNVLQCPCRNQGCWERYASAASLGRLANEILDEEILSEIVPAPRRKNNFVTSREIGAAAKQNHAQAKRVLQTYSEFLALGIHNLAKVINPEVVVLSGGITELGQTFLDPIQESYRKNFTSKSNADNLEILLAKFGNTSGSIGAAMLATESFSR